MVAPVSALAPLPHATRYGRLKGTPTHHQHCEQVFKLTLSNDQLGAKLSVDTLGSNTLH